MSHTVTAIATDSKTQFYASLVKQVEAVLHGERDWVANLSQTSALLMQLMPDLNWAGFYLFKGGELVLGPFQGKVACVRIKLGNGVCGTAAARQKTVVVPNVHEFPGHIACDSASNSEVVVPLVVDGRLIGVLDLDSPKLERFDEEDAEGLRAVVRVLLAGSDVK
jgi:L-methionine (R)-S-oxide reductase